MSLLLVVAMLVGGGCVGPDYVPPLQEWDGSSYRMIQVRPELIAPLNELFQELHEKGARPVLLSGYRSYERQAQMHLADPKWTEPAGCSEHQLGTAVDIGWMGYGLRSPHDQVLWPLLQELGPEYGFEVTYDGTGDIPAEPWHLNYQLEQPTRRTLRIL